MWYIIGKVEIAGSILGYVLANPVTKQLQAIQATQVASIVNQIYNASIENGQVILTDGSAPRLFYFDTNMRPIQDSTPNRIFIFSEDLDRKGNTYSVFTLSGFFTITETQLKAYDGKATLVNGKFVHQDGKIVISALRGTFPKTKSLVSKQGTKVNPYANTAKKEVTSTKEVNKPKEYKSHKKFRKTLEFAILNYATNYSVYKLMKRHGNSYTRALKANNIWLKTIQEPEFIYCDDNLIYIAKNSKTITEFVKSAHTYFYYLNRIHGKNFRLGLQKNRVKHRFLLSSLVLPEHVKTGLIKDIVKDLDWAESLIDCVCYIEEDNNLVLTHDTFNRNIYKGSWEYSALCFYEKHNNFIPKCTTSRSDIDISIDAVKKLCCFDFTEHEINSCLYNVNFMDLESPNSICCGIDSLRQNKFVFNIRFYYYYGDLTKKTEATKIIARLATIIKPNMSIATIRALYKSLYGEAI